MRLTDQEGDPRARGYSVPAAAYRRVLDGVDYADEGGRLQSQRLAQDGWAICQLKAHAR